MQNALAKIALANALLFRHPRRPFEDHSGKGEEGEAKGSARSTSASKGIEDFVELLAGCL